MKNAKRLKELRARLKNVSAELNQAIEQAKDEQEVRLCKVTISKAEAMNMRTKISQIISDVEKIDLEENFIPIQLIMVDSGWREIQAEIKSLRQ